MEQPDADKLIESLLQSGIRRIYGVEQAAVDPVQQAVQRDERLQWVPVPHEETAALAAAAETQLTGQPAACCRSSEPAARHLTAGVSLCPVGTVPQGRGCVPLHILNAEAPPLPRHWVPAAQVLRMAQLINAAPRVTFICGSGCAAAREALLALAARTQSPVVYTLRSKEFMEHDNPYAVGMTGPAGFGAAPQAVLEADLLVFWGADFADEHFLPQDTQMIHVHADAAVLGRSVDSLLAVQGSVEQVARALLPLVADNRDGEFLNVARSRHRRCINLLNRPFWQTESAAPLRAEFLMRLVSDYAEPDAVFAMDAGAPLVWAARYLQAGPQRRLLGMTLDSPAGSATSLAIGAKAAYPTRQVIAFCGWESADSLSRNLTAMQQNGIAVKVLVFDPAGAAEEEYSSMAAAAEMDLLHLSSPAAALDIVKTWLARRGPSLLHASVDPRSLPVPPDMEKLAEQSYCPLRTCAS